SGPRAPRRAADAPPDDLLPALGGRAASPAGARLNREDHLCPRPALRAQVEGAAQLVPHERAHDREPGAGARLGGDALTVVVDRQHGVGAAAEERDPNGLPAVLERVL